MAKITAAQQRDPDVAIYELRLCTTDLSAALEELGSSYPHCVAFGAIVGGVVRGVFVYTPSREGDQYSPVWPDRMKTWARIIGHLPVELRAMFEAELSLIKRQD